MDKPPEIITPTITLIGALMRISDRARICGRSETTIESDPSTMLVLRQMLCEEFPMQHQLYNPYGDWSGGMILFDNIRLKIRKHTCT